MIVLTISEYDENGVLVSKNDVAAHVVNSAEELHKLLDEAVAFKKKEDAADPLLEANGDAVRQWTPLPRG